MNSGLPKFDNLSQVDQALAASRGRWARGAIGGTLFTFKTYSVSYLELMHRMWTQSGPEGKRAVGWAIGMLLLMGAAGGLPFFEDAEDMIDGGAQLMGYNLSSKQWRKELLRDMVGKELADCIDPVKTCSGVIVEWKTP